MNHTKPKNKKKKEKIEKPKSLEDQMVFLIESISALIDDQSKFKKAVEKQIIDIRAELGKTNIPSEVDQNFQPIAPPATISATPAQGQGASSYVKEGINFGKGSPTEMADRQQGAQAPATGQFQGIGQIIANIFAQPEVGKSVIDGIISMIKPKPEFDQLITQWAMRDFMESYGRDKTMNKALMNMMVKKGFLQDKDVAPYLADQDVLFDPIRQRIEALKGGGIPK